jgi:hypothetical protein
MKKLFLIGLMLLLGSDWDEWKFFYENDNFILYIDRETIRKDGQL